MPQIRPLTEELQKIAIAELGEVPKRVAEDLLALKIWIRQQTHLNARTDDQFLVQFLRNCKYSLERAKQKIENFYSLKTKYPELFSTTDVDEPKFRQFNDTGSFAILPIPLNGSGPRIIMWRFNFSPQEFDAPDVIRQCVALCEVTMMSDPYACIYGTVVLFDFSQATANNLLIFTPNIMKKATTFLAKAIPVRVNAVYLVNLSTYAEKFSRMILHFIPEKLRRRVFICGSGNDIEKFPKKYLPQEYGGENGSLDELSTEYNNVWTEYREYFKENAKHGCIEHLRPGKRLDNLMELEFGGGSFRKIIVD